TRLSWTALSGLSSRDGEGALWRKSSGLSRCTLPVRGEMLTAPKVTLAGWVEVPWDGELTGWAAPTHQEYLATLFVPASVNQRLLSGPVTISRGLLPVVRASSVNVPAGVSWPSLLALFSANQRLPSGPVVMPLGLLEAVGTENSVMVPPGVMR